MGIFDSFKEKRPNESSEAEKRRDVPGRKSKASPLEWQIGDVIEDRYEIKKILGEGGMGDVYLVYDIGLHRHMIIKTPKHQYLEEGGIELFLHEGHVMTSVKGSLHIVTAYFVKEIAGRPCLLMEYIEGHNLRQFIGSLSLGQAVHFAVQFSRGMGYLHEFMGIVHLDIKPSNILITRDGIVKITDFGLGDFFHPKTLGMDMSQDSESERQQIAGTYSYMAPEQWEGKGIGKWSDIYSFGVVFYEMLTGQLPYYGNNRSEWHQAHMKAVPTKPSLIRLEIPTHVDELALKCLEKLPSNRPSSFYYIQNQLEEICIQLTGKAFSYTNS